MDDYFHDTLLAGCFREAYGISSATLTYSTESYNIKKLFSKGEVGLV